MNLLRQKLMFDRKAVLSLVAGESLTLSISHHLANFWGLPWETQALLVLLAAPLLAALIWFLLGPAWNDFLKRIRQKRTFLLLLPILILAAIISWRTFSLPVSWHELEILPAQSLTPLQGIQILEIKVPQVNGSVVQFSQLGHLEGWVSSDGVLQTSGSTPGPIQYSFYGPIGSAAHLIFLSSDQSAPVTIILDGKASRIDLAQSQPG